MQSSAQFGTHANTQKNWAVQTLVTLMAKRGLICHRKCCIISTSRFIYVRMSRNMTDMDRALPIQNRLKLRKVCVCSRLTVHGSGHWEPKRERRFVNIGIRRWRNRQVERYARTSADLTGTGTGTVHREHVTNINGSPQYSWVRNEVSALATFIKMH